MGASAIFEKQIEIKLFHPASTLESWIQAFHLLCEKPSVCPSTLPAEGLPFKVKK
jgi:hypothetical protein